MDVIEIKTKIWKSVKPKAVTIDDVSNEVVPAVHAIRKIRVEVEERRDGNHVIMLDTDGLPAGTRQQVKDAVAAIIQKW